MFVAALLCSAALSLNAQQTSESVNETLEPGGTASLPETFVRTDVALKASLKCRKFEKICLGLGPDCYCGGWLEITPDSCVFYDRCRIRIDTIGTRLKYNFDTIAISRVKWNDKPLKRDISISITSHHGKADLEIKSGSVSYVGNIDRWWEGGIPFLTNCGGTPMDVNLSFDRLKAKEPIWFYGDSYFSTRNACRWPYYLHSEGYCNWMADHLPGGGSKQLLDCFKRDLDFGTPKIAVWMLGMNDASDKDGKPDGRWLDCVSEFISICRENGIEPILTTIPTVPERYHDCKTRWVRNSGCRYIDWYEACGTDGKGNWTEGYLLSDRVHPTEAGAEALWVSVRNALPELEKEDALSAYRQWKEDDMTVVFPIVTDVHVNHTSRKYLHCLEKDVAIDSLFDYDFMTNLGDICTKMDDNILEATARCMLAFDGVFVYVPGNHDFDGEAGRHYTQDELSGALLDPFIPRSDGRLHRVEHKSYGWYDIPTKKCRVIFLDSMHTGTQEGKYYSYGDTQMEWLDAKLRNTPKGWSVVVLSHFMPHKNYGLWNPEKELNGSSIDKSIWRVQEVLSDYVKDGGRLAGMFCGDAHCSAYDCVDGVNMYVSQGLGGYPKECIREGISHIQCDFNRDFLLDVVVIKPLKREVAVFRVGAGGRESDRHFTY